MRNTNLGIVTVLTGPMRSGKTLELIIRALDVKWAEGSVVLFHYGDSSRESNNKLECRFSDPNSTADQPFALSLPSIPVPRNSTVINDLLPPNVDLVIIDEAQFFGMDIIEVVKGLRLRGVDVIVSGLDMDSFQQPFGPMPYLMAIADTVIKKTAVCYDCKEDAQTTFRLVDNTEQELVGDKEYITLCYGCYNFRVSTKD